MLHELTKRALRELRPPDRAALRADYQRQYDAFTARAIDLSVELGMLRERLAYFEEIELGEALRPLRPLRSV